MADRTHTRSPLGLNGSRNGNLLRTHPRFSIALVGLTCILVLMFFNSSSEKIQSTTNFPGKHAPGSEPPPPCVSGDLKKQMEQSEKMYAQGVEDRKALIKKVGPEPSKIPP